MGRGKIEIKRIENSTNRQVTFSKRRGGLLKKANELAVLCDARVGVVIFSSTGKMFEYCSPACSLRELIEQYQHATNSHFEEINHDQQILLEMTRMKNEMEKLETGIRRYTGDDLSSLTLDDVSDLEQQLEYSVSKVRARKHQLLNQQLDNLRRKEQILEDQNTFLYRMINENQQAALTGEVKLGEMAPLAMLQPPPAFAHSATAYYGGESSSSGTALQLMSAAPQLHADDLGFRLQPTQPNLQDPAAPCGGLHGHGLQLW
ncbi:MADS-box protein ZMM17 [Zea mays]|nr:MADS-box protein ZMM17 isoform X1 [Zea mays]XP_020393160.1 MADS-box protein ZMM17 isoform X1 [Zea mays]XP_020393161.1 MADS-box protein ZMM17 isoform X1 [Zea mays]AQK68749.1 zea mays MADS17 [Zea mays]PWZ23121.1 MADS-box protein ZMM17 [Zea mays]|eukprot:XP_020393159.1 MADS-box protein ZMM17 isoform X1 [Zea mays]